MQIFEVLWRLRHQHCPSWRLVVLNPDFFERIWTQAQWQGFYFHKGTCSPPSLHLPHSSTFCTCTAALQTIHEVGRQIFFFWHERTSKRIFENTKVFCTIPLFSKPYFWCQWGNRRHGHFCTKLLFPLQCQSFGHNLGCAALHRPEKCMPC